MNGELLIGNVNAEIFARRNVVVEFDPSVEGKSVRAGPGLQNRSSLHSSHAILVVARFFEIGSIYDKPILAFFPPSCVQYLISSLINRQMVNNSSATDTKKHPYFACKVSQQNLCFGF
uniref:Uncharacterized protein n=1 Tax=Romanomermis culicivorax TaxID=13658 RepID=A0A915IUA8_ROMCU